MTRSPSARRSLVLTSPDRGLLSRFLADDRNSEVSHRDALLAAQLEHDRVRKDAIRVYELHELEAARKQIEEDEKIERARLDAEQALVTEAARLSELRKKSIPKPPPEPPTPVEETRPVPATRPTPPTETRTPTQGPPSERRAVIESGTPTSTVPKPTSGPFANASGLSTAFAPAKPLTAPATQLTNGVTAGSTTATPPTPAAAAPPAARPAAPAASKEPSEVQRYTQIHAELRDLRHGMVQASKTPGSQLKPRFGNMRREIKVSIGQLTSVKGANAQPVGKIIAALQEALDGKVPSEPVEVSKFVLTPRMPVEGAANNGDTLPSLFICLLSHCAKAIISQFINECGVNPKAADPIGVFAAQIFSKTEFHWRGQSLIEILMAKFRKECPVVFGLRGSDKTIKGRERLGWKKDGTQYITEQQHSDRMIGLGAGFAAISLRDFSRTSKINPFPPTNYWTALARIINTPAGETSNTQYIVVRAMIMNYEQRFLTFYGNAALSALQLALVEFPKRAPAGASAAASLATLAELLRGDGLILA